MRWVLLEIAKFNCRFAKLLQCLQVDVLPLCDVASACDFECCVQVWDICEEMCMYTCILVCFVLMLFVNVCHHWTCELKMWNFSLVLSYIVMSGLRFVMQTPGGIVPPPAPHRCTAIKFVCTIFLRHIISYTVNQVSLTFMHHLNYKWENFQRGGGEGRRGCTAVHRRTQYFGYEKIDRF